MVVDVSNNGVGYDLRDTTSSPGAAESAVEVFQLAHRTQRRLRTGIEGGTMDFASHFFQSVSWVYCGIYNFYKGVLTGYFQPCFDAPAVPTPMAFRAFGIQWGIWEFKRVLPRD